MLAWFNTLILLLILMQPVAFSRDFDDCGFTRRDPYFDLVMSPKTASIENVNHKENGIDHPIAKQLDKAQFFARIYKLSLAVTQNSFRKGLNRDFTPPKKADAGVAHERDVQAELMLLLKLEFFDTFQLFQKDYIADQSKKLKVQEGTYRNLTADLFSLKSMVPFKDVMAQPNPQAFSIYYYFWNGLGSDSYIKKSLLLGNGSTVPVPQSKFNRRFKPVPSPLRMINCLVNSAVKGERCPIRELGQTKYDVIIPELNLSQVLRLLLRFGEAGDIEIVKALYERAQGELAPMPKDDDIDKYRRFLKLVKNRLDSQSGPLRR